MLCKLFKSCLNQNPRKARHQPPRQMCPDIITSHYFSNAWYCTLRPHVQAWLSWSERGTVNQRGGNSCILLFLVWFFLRPISPKEDTTHHLKPIVEAREYVYFLYIFIHTLTSRSQLPPFLSWFDYLNVFMYSPHMLTPNDMQDAQEDAIRT